MSEPWWARWRYRGPAGGVTVGQWHAVVGARSITPPEATAMPRTPDGMALLRFEELGDPLSVKMLLLPVPATLACGRTRDVGSIAALNSTRPTGPICPECEYLDGLRRSYTPDVVDAPLVPVARVTRMLGEFFLHDQEDGA